MSGPRVRFGWTDEQVEHFVGNLLRYGVMLAAAVCFVGGALYLSRHGTTPAAYHTFHGVAPSLHSLAGILNGVRALDAQAVIQLGVLLLIATPIARVALSLIAFAKQHDYTYVVITTIVLVILLWSLSGGRAA